MLASKIGLSVFASWMLQLLCFYFKSNNCQQLHNVFLLRSHDVSTDSTTIVSENVTKLPSGAEFIESHLNFC